MGQDVALQEFTAEDRTRFRERVHADLDVLARMLRESDFDADPVHVGLELEINLVDDEGRPAMSNTEVLHRIEDPEVQTELGRFNIEANVPPARLGPAALDDLEKALAARLDHARRRAQELGVQPVTVGILPSLDAEHLVRGSLSEDSRYRLIDQQILAARGEHLDIVIDGVEDLSTTVDTIVPEAACTSFQLHLQVAPREFAATWNASQAIAALQLAVGANSPFFIGRELWRETRIAVFEQATDTRNSELRSQGVRPRVWFGERWISSAWDLFEENAKYFPALLPVVGDEDPRAAFEKGEVPTLAELSLHNGTIYRWNRPVYGIADGRPHLRVENRVLPAGPTVVDALANAALYYGLVQALRTDEDPVWTHMSFAAAETNLHEAARKGIDAVVYWPRLGDLPATELLLQHLLPAAHRGLQELGIADATRERLLGIIAARCTSVTNGASWLAAALHRIEEGGAARDEALRALTLRYAELSAAGEPVHTWPVS
ncbi:MAG: glutamate--cysteine ligase [Actinomycetes bacterium]